MVIQGGQQAHVQQAHVFRPGWQWRRLSGKGLERVGLAGARSSVAARMRRMDALHVRALERRRAVDGSHSHVASPSTLARCGSAAWPGSGTCNSMHAMCISVGYAFLNKSPGRERERDRNKLVHFGTPWILGRTWNVSKVRICEANWRTPRSDPHP